MFLEWYSFLSSFYNQISGPLGQLGTSSPLPIVGALFLGLLGSTSPCQLTGNASAMAYIGQRLTDRRYVLLSTLAFLLGKVLVYTTLGIAFILLGLSAASELVPVVQIVRKALGPVFILMGLWLLGVIKTPNMPALSVSVGLQQRFSRLGVPGAFLLGVVVSLAFCPTMFLLFFGLTLPIGIASGQGYIFPSVFAFGTTIPLLVFGGLMTLGSGGSNRGKFLQNSRKINSIARKVAGVVLLLAGLNDTIVYWFL